MNIVKASLKNRQVALSILILAFAFGIYSLMTMPRREDPKINVPQGLVIAYYPGATAAQVEGQVTRKIEQYLFQYEEVKKAKTVSTSRDGVAIINVCLNDDVKKMDIFWSKLSHQLLVAKNLDLPPGVRGPLVNSGFGETEALLIAIESKTADYRQIGNYCRLLEEHLRTIKATSKIKRIGEQKEQITIYFDSDKLSQYGISLQQIMKILKSQNVIIASGEATTANNSVALYTKGYYESQNEIENQIVGTSVNGAIIHLGDIATLKREYAEPTSSISVNGHNAIIVAVQMNEGNNIVEFGKEVNRKLSEVSKLLPSDVKLTTIVNQPALVNENISHFLLEFFLSIISVIIVVVLMLPFRIAAVAAAAIPMTISITFAILHTFGIELHQVSLAALIVVLGMVVDDAIVVADNYVNLLDKGIDRRTAAWRSASDLIIPILTATITIIAAFMPMVVLTGVIGEFIHDLPVTVTIALASSFIVALILTPMLCYAFIHEGLKVHSKSDKPLKKRKTLLDIMQDWYNHAIEWCTRHHVITISSSIITIALAIIVFKTAIGQKFFPSAERNQFAIEIWMPTGTKLDKTKQAATKIENLFKADSRITSYAVFAGTSAPRVYYNFSPEFPVGNYAQILVNTLNNKTTEILANELEQKVNELIPEGTVHVKLMQQGQALIAPIEVRIFGEDINTLRSLSSEVKIILQRTKGSYLVNDDFKEDFYGISLDLKNEAARLGFTTENIAQLLYANTSGVVVSTMNEGDNRIDIVMRLDENKRLTTQNLEDVYLESPVTGKSVPLRQIADLSPKWQTGRIMHRNGLRCLTVRSETNSDVLPAQLLAKIRPDVEKLQLPAGYRIEFGGEYANKSEVFTQMIVALGIGLILIFLTLMMQFKNIKETVLIMLTIPLSVFGAMIGLAITKNNFGFTAFIGFISLSGIVVRNAIILIDHTNELIKNGMSIHDAAIEAGKRRLRPIFLTAMAAAIGVLPMIISGSSLWSPLATVIAFGVTWSMLMSLLTVPVLYIVIMRPSDKNRTITKTNVPGINLIADKEAVILIVLICIFIPAPRLQAQESSIRLSLNDIAQMAVHNNHLLKAKEFSIEEKLQRVHEDQVKFFPNIGIDAGYHYNQNLPKFTVPQGSFGQLPMGSTVVPLPSTDKTFDMGSYNTGNTGVIIYQPVTQIPKISAGMQVTKTELEISKIEKSKAEMQIRQTAEKLFYSILILQKQKNEAELNLAAANARLYDGESALKAEKVTNSPIVGLNAAVAGGEQDLLKIKYQIEDLNADLKQLTGIPDTVLIIADSTSVDDFHMSGFDPDSLLQKAPVGNTDLQIANLERKKAEYAGKVSTYSYLPDIGVIGGYSFQKGIAWYPESNVFAGVTLKWNITDLLSNTYIKSQRNYLKMQAAENIANVREQAKTDLSKAIRKLSQSAELISTARKVVDFRREDVKLQTDKQNVGMSIESELLTTQAALAKAEADLLAAQLDYRMTYTDIQILLGSY